MGIKEITDSWTNNIRVVRTIIIVIAIHVLLDKNRTRKRRKQTPKQTRVTLDVIPKTPEINIWGPENSPNVPGAALIRLPVEGRNCGASKNNMSGYLK